MTRNRAIRLFAGALTALVAGALPIAQATPAAIQENVAHVKNVPGSTGGHVVAEGDRLYVGSYGIGMRLFDISNPRNPVQTGTYFPGPSTNDGNDPGVRADAVPDAAVIDGKHIVTLNGTGRTATTQQTEFIDWTNPASPQLLARLRGGAGEAHNGDIVDSRRLWLPSGSATPNFRIYTLNPLLQTPPAAPTLVSPPTFNLVTAWGSSPFRKGRPTGPAFTHIHDQEIYLDVPVLLPENEWVDQNGDLIPDPTYQKRDLSFIAEGGNYVGGNNSGSFFVVDITNPAAPVVRLRWMHGAAAGHHAWRYFHEIQLLDADRHVGFVSDEDLHNGCNAGGVMSVRFSEDYTNATELDEWFVGGLNPNTTDPASSTVGPPAPVCSAHVFSSKGNYVFMGSYNAGLQVIDFTNPADLKRAGQYIMPGANSWGALAYRGLVYVGDFGARGLDVFQFAAKPDAQALVKAMNPATRTASGVTEVAAACDPASPANGVDGVLVAIPAGMRDGTHLIRAITSADPGSEVDIWFYDENCDVLENGLASNNGAEETGLIAEGARFAVATLYAGAPNHVYVQLDPAL